MIAQHGTRPHGGTPPIRPVLILGAWGCGVFGNDPALVARAFAAQLGRGGRWSGRFQRFVFSILDQSPAQHTLEAFQRVLGERPS